MWVILFLPVLLALLFITVEIGNLWLARVELENSLEAAALAAVKEWGDANGGDTLIPRRVGVQYAAANTIGGNAPVAIGLNYDASNQPNENADCSGNLIFGAITTPSRPYTFNAGVTPACGAETVLFDATGQGNVKADNAWGIALHKTPETPPDLRIVRIVIDLRGGGGDGYFDFEAGKGKHQPASPPRLSDNVEPHKVHDHSGNDQPDIYGFVDDPSEQIIFTPTDTNSPTLTIDFLEHEDDDGFAPGDRFRFGARVRDVSKGSGGDDGDGIGRDHVTATVYFTLGGSPLPPVSGTFFDNEHVGYIDPAMIDPLSGSLIVHPTEIPDLPAPEAHAPKNNGQSFVLMQGSGPYPFAVRAQAIARIDSPLSNFCGMVFGQFTVQAKTTAMYDCTERRPRLVRIDTFICPGP